MIVVHSVKRKVRLLNMYFYFAKIFSYYGILSASTFIELLILDYVFISTMSYQVTCLYQSTIKLSIFYIVNKTIHIPVFDAEKNNSIYSPPMSY